jgi:hypothetical protein
MSILTTDKLVELLLKGASPGYEVSRRFGILNSTKCIYYKKGLIFLFDITEDFVFKKANGYTAEEFTSECKNEKWLLEMAID